MTYDALAEGYDGHFSRPVDRWEDERLASLLRPHVNGRTVLDLGCGTGWVPDHCVPFSYTGVDESAPMLEILVRKHPRVTVIKAEVGTPGWVWAPQTPEPFDTVVCTWALQYLFGGTLPLRRLLVECSGLVRPGGVIALHGYLPRYRHRQHYIGALPHPPVVRPAMVRRATAGSGLLAPRLHGCGALPDRAAFSERAWWATLRVVPAAWHYSGLWIWRKG